jgi:hypothetical protein
MVKGLFKTLLFTLLLPNLAFAQTGTLPLVTVDSSPAHSTVKTLSETYVAPKVRKSRLREHLHTAMTIGLTLATGTLAYFYYAKSRQLHHLTQQFAGKSTECENLTTQFNKQTEALTTLTQQFAETDGKLQALTQTLETKSTECWELTERLQATKTISSTLKAANDNLLKETSQLMETTQAQESTIQQLTRELKKMQQYDQDRELSLSTFKELATQLTSQLAAWEKQHSDFEQQKASLETERQSLLQLQKSTEVKSNYAAQALMQASNLDQREQDLQKKATALNQKAQKLSTQESQLAITLDNISLTQCRLTTLDAFISENIQKLALQQKIFNNELEPIQPQTALKNEVKSDEALDNGVSLPTTHIHALKKLHDGIKKNVLVMKEYGDLSMIATSLRSQLDDSKAKIESWIEIMTRGQFDDAASSISKITQGCEQRIAGMLDIEQRMIQSIQQASMNLALQQHEIQQGIIQFVTYYEQKLMNLIDREKKLATVQRVDETSNL